MSKCIFCDKETIENHHILPQAVKRYMGWTGTKYGELGKYKIPICHEHHQIFHQLTMPLVFVIRCLTEPDIPFELYKHIDRVYTKYNGVDE